MKYAIAAPRIFTGETWLFDNAIIIEGDRIVAVKPRAEVDASVDAVSVYDGLLCAGFIDLQVNGGGGLLFNDKPELQTLLTMANAHRAQGTTSLLPTLMSDTPAVTEHAIKVANSAFHQYPNQLLGIHIEGPFFNSKKKGIHSGQFIRPFSEADVNLLSMAEGTRLLTLAPECVQPVIIERLRRLGFSVWAGHSDALFDTVKDAIASGLSGFTHLYNAMSMLNAREPAMIGSALTADECWTSIIADGHHVHPSCIEVAMRCKPKGKLLLVSDSMCTVGSEQTDFILNEERIYAEHGVLKNAQGMLAGSAISLFDAINYLVDELQLDEAEAIRMATLYPAEAAGLSDILGKIAPGHQANIVHIDGKTVCNTWVNGQVKDHRDGELL